MRSASPELGLDVDELELSDRTIQAELGDPALAGELLESGQKGV